MQFVALTIEKGKYAALNGSKEVRSVYWKTDDILLVLEVCSDKKDKIRSLLTWYSHTRGLTALGLFTTTSFLSSSDGRGFLAFGMSSLCSLSSKKNKNRDVRTW